MTELVITDEVERSVFRHFAEICPHEAHDLNRVEFIAFVKDKYPILTDDVIEKFLEET